jgi:Cu2+-exporting ATPase
MSQGTAPTWLADHRGALEVNDDFRSLDDEEEQATFTNALPDGEGAVCESRLVVQGMYCAACADAVEAAITRQPGVLSAQVNAATRRVTVRWDRAQTAASRWARAAGDVGYRLLPVHIASSQEEVIKAQRSALWRLFVAGFCAMQVMMYSWPLYIAEPGTISPDIDRLLRWASWWLSLPVVLFASQPFFASAWRDLRQGRIGMDFPVTVGILVTFAVSTAATYDPAGPWGQDIWFDSLTMLVFFLLGGRYLEAKARTRTAGALDALMTRLPDSVERQDEAGAWQRVSARRLREGDVVRVAVGQSFPGDGVLLSAAASVDEALLTGEALPVEKSQGDALIAGSRNLAGPVALRLQAVGQGTRFAQIVALMERALHDKPRLAVLADRIAGPFLLGVVVLSALVGLYWWGQDSAMALSTAVAVLIVTCPCALSLATPAAMLSTAGALARQGVLLQRIQALEALTRVSAVVFDKTGTLTEPQLHGREVKLSPTAGGLSAERVHAIAAGLARGSVHPLALSLQATAPAAADETPWHHWREHPGQGIAAEDAQGGLWRLGSAAWCQAPQQAGDALQVHLAGPSGWLASFVFEERVKADASALVQAFEQAGVAVHLISGDRAPAVHRVAQALSVTQVVAEATPQVKREALQALQAQGQVVLMVGDGLNDAPVMSQADVSIAMGSGAALTQTRADVIVQSAHLGEVLVSWRAAQRTLRVVRQNLWWALGYNVIAVPLAAAGWMPPWVAGLGMAASSLVVVLNALRLRQVG